MTAHASHWPLYVGTYTHDGRSRGIHRARVDRSSGALTHDGVAAETPDPSFLALAADGRTLYAVNELTEHEGRATGTATAFRRDPASGALRELARRETGGGAPCHLTVDRAGRALLVANYVGGSVAVLPLGPEGVLDGAPQVVRHAGRGPHPERQTAPHAHCVLLDPAERFALVCDLGIDRVRVYRYAAAAGALVEPAVHEVALAPGAGPRHLAFAPDGRTVYVVAELANTLVAYDYDAASGTLRERQMLSSRGATAQGASQAAGVQVHPAGHTVYVSNRGDDTIAAFTVEPATGRLTLAQTLPSGGHWPRAIALSPDGALLLAADERADTIAAFTVDAHSGRLRDTGQRLAIPSPTSVLFADAGTGGA